MILISSGFDSAKGDPLGNLEVEDAYSYFLESLLKLKYKIAVMLEGGYNLKSIALASEQVLRSLLGQKMPLKNSFGNKSAQELKNNCLPNDIGIKTVSSTIEVIGEKWKLNQNYLLDFEENVL